LLKIFVRTEEPYIRPNLEQALIRTESIDSNAINPNNPGPGRNLGRLYDNLGMRLERFLNRMAGRLKLGPDAALQEILELRRYDRSDEPNPLSGEELRILTNLCRKLLKYCGSQDLETQRQALNAVIALAVRDIFVREVLACARLDSYLSIEYEEMQIRLLSAKAMISIKDNEVHEAWSNYCRCKEGDLVPPNDFYSMWLMDRIRKYLNDPNVTFLVGRLIQARTLVSDYDFMEERGWYVEAGISNPQVIEWETLNEFLFNYGGEYFAKYYNRIIQ